MMVDPREIVRRSSLFEELSDEDTELFLSCAKTESREQGEIIFVEMQEDDSIYLILEGEVELEHKMADDAHHRPPLVFGPGFPLGTQAFIKPGPRLVTATAVTPVTMLKWQASDWNEICEGDPRIGFALSKSIAKRLLKMLVNEHFECLNELTWGLGG